MTKKETKDPSLINKVEKSAALSLYEWSNENRWTKGVQVSHQLCFSQHTSHSYVSTVPSQPCSSCRPCSSLSMALWTHVLWTWWSPSPHAHPAYSNNTTCTNNVQRTSVLTSTISSLHVLFLRKQCVNNVQWSWYLFSCKRPVQNKRLHKPICMYTV